MEKKLPKVFANKIEKTINNNSKIYNSTSETDEKKPEIQNNNKVEKTILKKINEIMNSKKYIYKIPVKININGNEKITKIIGKNKTNIITIDNEIIKIEEINDIEIYDENKNEI